jgi:hypothetical protein
MKKLALMFALVSASVLMISCGSQKVLEKTQPVESKTSTTTTTANEPKAIVYKDISDVRDPVIETSATLKDDTGIGFNYEGKNVLDNDFSTSWCGTKAGIGDYISFNFKDPVQAGKMGILPGYGRDESIYFGNNRIKEMKAVFTDVDGKTSEKTFNLPDKYAMNFVDLADVKFKSVKLVVNDIYKASNDPDTCIAELDFWSDYVKNEDASAAMNYYNKYKESQALRPKNIVSKILFSNSAPNKCGTPVKATSDFVDEKFGVALDAGATSYASAVINNYGKIGDKLTVKWYAGARTEMAPEWTLVDTKSDIQVVADCSGKLYVNAASGVPDWGLYRVEFFNGEKSVGAASFFLAE